MNTSELGETSVQNLQKELLSLREQQFKLRMQKSTAQLGQTHLLKQTRRDIARLKTVLAQRAGD